MTLLGPRRAPCELQVQKQNICKSIKLQYDTQRQSVNRWFWGLPFSYGY